MPGRWPGPVVCAARLQYTCNSGPVTMLYSERKRQEELEAREAAGESLWTREFSPKARVRIWHVWEAVCAQFGTRTKERLAATVRGKLLRDLGRYNLSDQLYGPTTWDEVRGFLHRTTDLEVGSVIEAMAATLDEFASGELPYFYDVAFEAEVNQVFRLERLAYSLVEGRIVDMASEELHQAIVVPAVRLLAGRRGWEGVETAYQNALGEIADGGPDNAITDAATALQEALGILGCEGNSLGRQVDDAKRRGLLAPHDPTLGAAILKLVDWASGDRSGLGDGHKAASGATCEDAYLTVHVVGALILRLAQAPPRGSA
jgi:hypothetical protein